MSDKVLIWIWIGCSVTAIVGMAFKSEYSIMPLFLAFGVTFLNVVLS